MILSLLNTLLQIAARRNLDEILASGWFCCMSCCAFFAIIEAKSFVDYCGSGPHTSSGGEKTRGEAARIRVRSLL